MDKSPCRTVEIARSFVGVPFVHQGRGRAGLDCLGLLLYTLELQGLVPPGFERHNYSREPNQNDELERRVAHYCTRLEAPEPGGVLTMAWHGPARHLAIVTDVGTIIHADARPGVERVTEVGYRPPWSRLKAKAWRLPDGPVHA